VAVCARSHQELPPDPALQYAPTAKSYDRATVLDLKPTEWRELALAA
jgi:hypothetical protein